MKNYFLEELIKKLMEDHDNRDEVIDTIEMYFKNNFTKEELLELLVRGQEHALNDDRTKGYYSV